MRETRGADVHRALGGTLTGLGAHEIISSYSRAWASATFTGARHIFIVTIDEEAGGAFAALSEYEFDVPGHLIADVVVVDRCEAEGERTLLIEILSVENG